MRDPHGHFSGYFHFSKENVEGSKSLLYECRLCPSGKIIRTSTNANSNLRSHIQVLEEFQKCRLRMPRGSISQPEAKRFCHQGPSSAVHPSPESHQDARRQHLTDAILRYAASRLDTYEASADFALKTLVFNILELTGQYFDFDFPTPTTLEALTRDKYIAKRCQAIEQLKEIKYVACTADAWMESDQSFLFVTCNWIDWDYRRRQLMLMCGEVDKTAIPARLTALLAEFGIAQKNVSILTGGAAHFLQGLSVASADAVFLDIAHCLPSTQLPSKVCTTRLLDLAVTSDFDSELLRRQPQLLDTLARARTKCRSVWRMHGSEEATPSSDTLIKPCPHKWDSQQEATRRLLHLRETDPSRFQNYATSSGIAELRDDEVSALKVYESATAPVAQAMERLGAAEVACGATAPVVAATIAHTSRLKKTLGVMAEVTEACLEARCGHLLHSLDLGSAMLLHPQFYLLETPSKLRENAKQDLRCRLDLQLVNDSQVMRDPFFREALFGDSFKAEPMLEGESDALDRFLDDKTVLDEGFAGLERHGKLYDEAIRLNTPMASFASVERGFAASGLRHSHERKHSLRPDALEQRLFLQLSPLQF